MDERSRGPQSNTPARKSLAGRFLRRLLLVLLIPVLGYALLILIWILLSPRM
jgi:hypothetical protein